MPIPSDNTVAARIRAIREGDRRALARAITLVESARTEDRPMAEALVDAALPHSGRAVRIGLSGAPGAGKSSLIEALGLHLVEAGHRLAVLAVDPSSPRTGGSILGDKTRMEELARNPHAFIRPSPSGGTLGGVARRTREAMVLVEAAGFDVVIVETVGVGQSEIAVADMVDSFVLVLLPGAGDELQGIKRGIVERADLVVVNKADGEMMAAARHAAAEYRHALALLSGGHGGWRVPVLLVSALERRGLQELWAAILSHRESLGGDEALIRRRAGQARAWLMHEIASGLEAAFMDDPAIGAAFQIALGEVEAGRMAAPAAARRLVERFLGRGGGPDR